MTFQDYCGIIEQSVAEEGYHGFFPSMAEVDDEVCFRVLECELDEGGDEHLALDWAQQITKPGNPYYLAYRAGNDKVEVCEKRDSTVLKLHRIKVVD